MGESLDQFVTSFNRSIRVECREDRLTGDAGAIPIREVMDRTGVTRELASRLLDSRDSARVRYSLETLLRERVSLLCQGWFDQDDADRLRWDPAFRASVCSGKGAGVLAEDQGLASQPTMSRLLGMMKTEENLEVLNEVLLGYGMRRILSERGSRRLRRMVIDLDGLPVEAHGNQSGSEWNGHYRQRMFHPLVASSGEHGDLLGGIVRRGACSSADGSPDFVSWLCERLIGKSCRSVLFRIDAGFSGDAVLSVIEDRRQSHVSRLVDNAVLARMARPHLPRPPGRPPRSTRVRLYEDRYRAGELEAGATRGPGGAGQAGRTHLPLFLAGHQPATEGVAGGEVVEPVPNPRESGEAHGRTDDGAVGAAVVRSPFRQGSPLEPGEAESRRAREPGAVPAAFTGLPGAACRATIDGAIHPARMEHPAFPGTGAEGTGSSDDARQKNHLRHLP